MLLVLQQVSTRKKLFKYVQGASYEYSTWYKGQEIVDDSTLPLDPQQSI